jgi:hypothetical protein
MHKTIDFVLVIIFVVCIALIVQYIRRKVINTVMNGSNQGFQDQAVDNNPVIVVPTPQAEAMKAIEDNLAKERQLITTLLPFYNKVVTITAGNKAKVAKAPEGQDTIPKETVEANTKAAEPKVRKDIDIEGQGKVAPLYDMNMVLEALDKSGLSKAAIYKISYMFLPVKVDIYSTTATYLNTKAEELYKYLIDLGGPQTATVQGSSAESLGVTIKSGFADGPGAACCSVPDIVIDSNTIKTDKSLRQLVDQYKAKPPTDQDIQTLYEISQTRRRLLDAGATARASIMEQVKTNFKKLEDLMMQMEESSDKAYSGVIADGKSPQAALDAFVDASNWSYAGSPTTYSYLLRP